MLKTKKGILIIALLVCVIVAGTIVGAVAFAQTGSNSQDQTANTSNEDTLLAKVAQIYQTNTGVALDVQQLKTAFAQAQGDMRDEALQNWLNKLVQDGKLTQSEADAYMNWWKSKPDTKITGDLRFGFGGMITRGGHGFGGQFRCQPPDTSTTPEASGSGL